MTAATGTPPTVTGMVCQHCGCELPTRQRGMSRAKMARRKYCSKECSAAGRTGRQAPDRTEAPQTHATPVHCRECGQQIAADDTITAATQAVVKAIHRRYCPAGQDGQP